MTDKYGFCNYHKRWFDTQCDYCQKEEYEAQQYSRDYKRFHTAAGTAIVLSAHSDCGHLVTDVIDTPYGQYTVLQLQMLAFQYEHKGVR